MRPRPDPVAPGQESVWDFPRPPRVEPCASLVEIVLGGVTIVSTTRSVRVLETSHPPSYYIPPEDILPGVLIPAAGSSFCEWKGDASYFDAEAGGRRCPRVAWAYPDPTPLGALLANHVAFYAGPMDRCTVDGAVVTPQPGGFYGGWITEAVAGPFKGVPGSWGW